MAEVRAIQPISKEVAHRICTGQVISSLAGACKELIDNALDAGARSIGWHLFFFWSTIALWWLECLQISAWRGTEPTCWKSVTTDAALPKMTYLHFVRPFIQYAFEYSVWLGRGNKKWTYDVNNNSCFVLWPIEISVERLYRFTQTHIYLLEGASNWYYRPTLPPSLSKIGIVESSGFQIA